MWTSEFEGAADEQGIEHFEKKNQNHLQQLPQRMSDGFG
jgi:hypothetical protein